MSENRSNGNRPPHAATVPRGSAVQAKVAKAGPGAHAATSLSSEGIAQPKTAPHARPPHPATVGRAGVAQPKTAPHARPPHPATVVQAKSDASSRAGSGTIQRKCAHCGENGHSEKNCPYPKDDLIPELVEKAPKFRPKKPKTKVGKVPDVLEWSGPSLVSGPTRPSVGTTLQDLQNMDHLKNLFPSTFAQTMHDVGGYTVEDMGLLSFGQGTEKETHEWKVSLSGMHFVVHYHPNVVIPKGVQNGESRIHVKGKRGSKHHENMSDFFLSSLGIS